MSDMKDEIKERSNSPYIQGLLKELSTALDKYIMTGSKTSIGSALNIVAQIEKEAMEEELIDQAKRMMQRAGVIPKQTKIDPKIDKKETRPGSVIRSEPDIPSTIETLKMHDKSKKEFVKEMNLTPSFSHEKKTVESTSNKNDNGQHIPNIHNHQQEAEEITSALIAKAGSAFDGESLGIGGLDDILSQIKRRIWVPLAAPPSLLKELGIDPVNGLLLYGPPGCGKTLLAKSLGKIISPMRPVTVVSGPEIMDRFVGSSEKNLRTIFDNPPDIYDKYRIGTKDNGESLAETALHVIVLDEFDAIARSRGGNNQGDAGVARDSVVNQLLAKMDGVDKQKVPTLLIALTNKLSLIDSALLRPGRFEVKIEVLPPKSLQQRISILHVHMKHMNRHGRLLVLDAPPRTAGCVQLERMEVKGLADDIPTYTELLEYLAEKTSGMSGASLAGVARAAASRALERTVFSSAGGSMNDCVVTCHDLESAIQDVMESARIDDDDASSKKLSNFNQQASQKKNILTDEEAAAKPVNWHSF